MFKGFKSLSSTSTFRNHQAVFDHFTTGKHRKGSREPDNISDTSQRSSLNIPEGSIVSPPSDFAHSRESSLSAQTLPTQRSRPVSEDFAASTPARASPAPRPVSEVIQKFPTVPSSTLATSPAKDNTTTPPPTQDLAPVAPSTPEAKPQSVPRISTQAPSLPKTSPPQVSVRSNLSTQTSIVSYTPERTEVTSHTSSMTSPRVSTNGNLNGQNGTNGVLSPPMSPKTMFQRKGRLPSFTSSRAPSNNFSTMMKTPTKRANGGSSHKIGLVQESAAALKKRSMAELGAGVYQSVSNVSYVNFLEWIRSERLTTLPHKVIIQLQINSTVS
jgi:hypothetical protein